MNKNTVTRFAPSPTGFMHVGGVRTALYAWLFARKHGGTFILRIEDTDKAREVEGSIAHIVESLRWLGITWDEGVEVGGPNGPYLQSERLDHYKKYAEMLIAKGLAYPDPYTEEEIEAFRQAAIAEKRPFLYRDHRPETFDVWDGTQALRLKVPEIKRYTWTDLVRGELSAGEEALDDFILIKSDGYPTYNFAHIIDDLEMGTTHIMRAEEFVASTPKFLSLYDALGITPPHLATMPVILGPDGNKKLSKRDGAKDILDYRREGYLPEALVNFLALLGWHPENDAEVLTVDELAEVFTLERIQKGGARFDEQKLLWLNQQHLARLPLEEFIARVKAFAATQDTQAPAYLQTVAAHLQTRAQTLAEALEHLTTGEFSFMNGDFPGYSKDLLLKGAKAESGEVLVHLQKASDIFGSTEAWTESALKDALWPYASEVGRSAVLWPLRVALTGKEKSPDPFIVASLLGKQETVRRITDAVNMLQRVVE